ncbi:MULTISPECIES: hypothetical protein [unclassified Tolypothrix]|uniref:hypothetical protein n=1 Tax=unclassified Tolypothrix TaxID=2649714 RepID=UPI0012D7DBE6|nr:MULTISPECIES: hypothetical protein [unclassified Tolypothrix]UYD36104.1 hypothetical protein HG267_10365 [Tolypothrix sp. PCC 7601]
MGTGDWDKGIGDWGLGIGTRGKYQLPITNYPLPKTNSFKTIRTLISLSYDTKHYREITSQNQGKNIT